MVVCLFLYLILLVVDCTSPSNHSVVDCTSPSNPSVVDCTSPANPPGRRLYFSI